MGGMDAEGTGAATGAGTTGGANTAGGVNAAGRADADPQGSPLPPADDTFCLYDLKVEVVEGDRPFVCSHRAGDYFLVEGENLVFPAGSSFSMYALAALLPLLPAKQRPLDPHDWMLSDALIACPDPNCGARFKITRTARRTQSHAACTVVPLPPSTEKTDGHQPIGTI